MERSGMMRGCRACGFMTADLTVERCPNDPDHPPLVELEGADDQADDADVPALAVAPAEPAAAAPQPANEDAADGDDERPPQPAPAADAFADRPRPALADPAQAKTDNAAVLERLKEITGRRAAPLVIGLMGFSTTGKTWFLERLKAGFQEDFEIEPPPQWSRSRTVGPTRHGASLHRFSCPGNPKRSFYVVDVPGELYRIEMQSGFTGASVDMLQVIALCNAYAFVVPAAEYLFMQELFDRGALIDGLPSEAHIAARGGFTPEARRQINEDRYQYIETMHHTLSRLALAIGYVQACGGVEAALAAGMDAQKLLDFGERNGVRCGKPAALLLTMADRMQPVIDASVTADPRLQTGGSIAFDADPVPIAMRYRPGILKGLARSFRWWKVDFATASDLHEGGEDFDAASDHYGVLDTIDWFRRVRRWSAVPRWALPMDSRRAAWVRGVVNPQFGAAWRHATKGPA
jgi:hypothetical protein